MNKLKSGWIIGLLAFSIVVTAHASVVSGWKTGLWGPKKISEVISDSLKNHLDSRIRAYVNGADSVIANDTVVVEFDAETFDEHGEWDATTNRRFTALETGYYWVTSTVEATEVVPGFRLAIYVDGVAYSWGLKIGIVEGEYSATVTDLVYLAAGSYVDIRMTAIATVVLQTGESRSYVSIHKAS